MPLYIIRIETSTGLRQGVSRRVQLANLDAATALAQRRLDFARKLPASTPRYDTWAVFSASPNGHVVKLLASRQVRD